MSIQQLDPNTGQPITPSFTIEVRDAATPGLVSVSTEETVYADFYAITTTVFGGDSERAGLALAAMGADPALLASMHDRYTQASVR